MPDAVVRSELAVTFAPERARSPLEPDDAARPSGAARDRIGWRRRPRQVSLVDVSLLASSALAAVSLVWFAFYQLTVFSGAAAFVFCSVVAFLGIYYVANREVFDPVTAVDRVVGSIVTLGAVAAMIPLGMIVAFLVQRGLGLVSWHFLTADQRGVTQLMPARAGGISHAIIGTLEQVGIAVVIGAPAGIVTAIFLNEVGGRITGAIRVVITAMSAIPSIVAGLFILVVLVLGLGYGFRGFAGSLALAILLLPNITRTTEEVLKVVPHSLREASMAVGAQEWRTVWSVVLPTARTGIVTAVLLGIARVVGETAPLLLTIGSNYADNANLFHGEQESLPIFVYTYRSLSRAADVERAFAAGLVLVGLVLILFVLARLVAGLKPGTVSRLVHGAHHRPKAARS